MGSHLASGARDARQRWLSLALGFGALYGVAVPVPAQTPGISVGPNVQVSMARDTLLHDEVLLGTHPTDPDRMIACSIAAAPGDYALVTIAYSTADGGRTWSPTVTDPGPYSGDPVCVFGPGDTAYFGAIAYKADPPVLRIYRSSDGGTNWSDPTEVEGVPDRPYLAVDRTAGPHRGRLYVPYNGAFTLQGIDPGQSTFTLGLITSTDGGRTFGNPVFRALLSDSASRGFPGGGVILSDGTLVLLFNEMRVPRPPHPGTARAALKVHTSADGGRTLSAGSLVSDVYGTRTPDQGETPFPSIDGLPVIAVDESDGPFRDRLYVAWYDTRSGRSEILLSFSSDRGRTWSAPRTINDDRERPRRPGERRGPNHLMPSVAVNRDGVVGVSWYDRRHTNDDLGWHVRFRASLDGGETWLPSVQVSEQPERSGPNELWAFEPQARALPGGSGTAVNIRLAEWPTGGHTAGLAARADGVFFPLWIDGRTGRHQVWTAPVTVQGRPERNGSPVLARAQDLSGKLSFELRYVWVDSTRSVVRARAMLHNGSADTLQGPFHVRVQTLNSRFATVTVADADNGVTGEGAVWAFPAPAGGALLPNQSITREIVFRLEDVRSPEPAGIFLGDLLTIRARVLGTGSAVDR